jgi:hypothetical protein
MYDLEWDVRARRGTLLPEATGLAAARDRVHDYERDRIRRAFSTSRPICC